MKTVVRTHVAAVMLLLPLSAAFLAPPVAAQQQRSSNAIYAMTLRAPGGLAPDGMLFVSVTATPGAAEASVTLGNGLQIPLQEQSQGSWTGSYTVRQGDRFNPRQNVTVRVRWADGTATRTYPLPPDLKAALQPQTQTRPEPASRPTVPVAAAPTIERFTVEPGGRIVAGRKLQFRLTGQPRAGAAVEIPGVVRSVPLRETSRGVYEGSYTVRSTDKPRDFDSAVATLREGRLSTTAELDLKASIDDRRDRGEPRADRPADAASGPRGDRPRNAASGPRGDRPAGQRGEQRSEAPAVQPVPPAAPAGDQQPPQISNVTPANGETVAERRRTRIAASLADVGSGIDAASVRLSVDGVDVTRNAEITADQVRWRENLGIGRHNAELVVRDRAGNSTRTAWSFRVQ